MYIYFLAGLHPQWKEVLTDFSHLVITLEEWVEWWCRVSNIEGGTIHITLMKDVALYFTTTINFHIFREVTTHHIMG